MSEITPLTSSQTSLSNYLSTTPAHQSQAQNAQINAHIVSILHALSENNHSMSAEDIQFLQTLLMHYQSTISANPSEQAGHPAGNLQNSLITSADMQTLLSILSAGNPYGAVNHPQRASNSVEHYQNPYIDTRRTFIAENTIRSNGNLLESEKYERYTKICAVVAIASVALLLTTMIACENTALLKDICYEKPDKYGISWVKPWYGYIMRGSVCTFVLFEMLTYGFFGVTKKEQEKEQAIFRAMQHA